MTINDAFNAGIIPEQYKGVFPTHCRCGSEIEITESLTKMWCPNERCDWKQIARMNNMLTNFGVKDIGEAYCKELWECLKYEGLDDSYVNVFRLPFHKYPEINSKEVTAKRFNNIQSAVRDSWYDGGLYLGELIAKLSLPGLDNNARKLFFGFNSLQDMVNALNKHYNENVNGLYRYIQSMFGYGVASRKIYESIRIFKQDILTAQRIFNVKEPVYKSIRIAITGSITRAGKYTRKNFIKYCNNICNGVAEVVDGSASSSIMFVVADSPSDSSKYAYGRNNDCLITSDKFVEYLKSEVI